MGTPQPAIPPEGIGARAARPRGGFGRRTARRGWALVRAIALAAFTGLLVAMIVATIKGSLVACYFMHLISEKKLIYAVLGLTVAFFIALLFLPILTVHNGYWMRG